MYANNFSSLIIIIAILVLGLLAQFIANHSLKKYNKYISSTNLPGAEAARQMLAYYGVNNVPIQQGAEGQDFYDPRSRSITLSPSVYSGSTVTSTAVVCHEVGHACQHAEGYSPMKLRTALVPVVNLCSALWIIPFILGIFMQIAGLTIIAVCIYAAILVFNLVTLPVEFNASNRAVKYLSSTGLTGDELKGTKRVLTSCAFTYVIAALVSALQILYILLGSRR